MPKVKQPIPLQKIAFNSLVEHVVRCCDTLSVAGFLIRLRQGITDIKQHVHHNLPGVLFAEFCRSFLENFYSIDVKRAEKRPPSHHKAALEIMMDVEVVGLRCEGRIVRHLDLSEAHRLYGLKVLDWTEPQYYESVPNSLEHFRLQDLTTFIYPRKCTDLDLEVIGRRCPKLQILRIEESENVTDGGLRALRSCSELRIINLNHCSVSDNGVNELLDIHKKLEEFNIGDYHAIGGESFNLLSRPISSVCPSVKRFALKSDPVTSADLHSVVAVFPNLTYLAFCSPFIGDLCILRDLKNLEKLEFGCSSGGFSMENLKKLLMNVGENISRLTIRSNTPVTQNDLNFIFKSCGNIECLNFGYEPHRSIEKLIIPPFKNLKSLDCVGYPSPNNCCLVLEFCELSELESLRLQNFNAIFQIAESIILDNKKFPNLREMRTFHNYHDREIIDRILQNAKNKNLDFSLLTLQ